MFFLITLFLCAAFGNAQNAPKPNTIDQILKTAPLDSLASNSFKHYNADDFSYAIDVAITMSKTENNEVVKERGANLMATLAKSFTKKVISKKLNLDKDEVKEIVVRFESEKYFIVRPKTSRFIKLAIFLCKSDYAYVHKKLIGTMFYRILLVFIFIYFSIFLLTYSNKFNWKFKKQFRRFTLFSVIIVLIAFALFKTTCHNNIKDYSFYGISI